MWLMLLTGTVVNETTDVDCTVVNVINVMTGTVFSLATVVDWYYG